MKGGTDPVAFDAFDSELVVVAGDAHWLALVRYERAGADRARTLAALEALLVPLARVVQVLLRAFHTTWLAAWRSG